MYRNSSSVSTESPTLHDQHTDAAVRLRGLPDESRQEPDERGDDLTPEEVDYLATRDHAQRHSLGLYKLVCKGFPSTYEIAESSDAAWPQARKRGWAKGGGPVRVETILTPETKWGRYPVEVLTGDGWRHLCHIRARSARAAVSTIGAKYPNHRLRAGSLHSVEAHRRIDRT